MMSSVLVCERQQDVTAVCLNEDQDFKVKIGDLIASSCTDYQVQAVLGCGAYGLVTQCLKMSTRETVALKIFTKKQSIDDAKEEEAILKMMKALNSDKFNVISLKNSFNYRGHYCLEFEKLDMTLRDFLKKNQEVSLQLEEIRPILHQLATALDFLMGAKIIHADLKPENVMLVDHVQQPLKVKIIDLGLAMQNLGESRGRTLQSLWYRSPEVLLGAPVSEAIDVWSLGCVSAELLMGIPLFDCNNKYDLMRHIVCMLGKPPEYLLKAGLFTRMYFSRRLRLKTKMAPTAKFIFTPRTLISLNDLVMVYEDRSGEDGCAVHCDLVMFVNLLTLMLMVDPRDRIRAGEILQHPFLTMSHLNGSFSNSYYVKSSRELLSICQDQKFDKGDNVTLTTQQMNLGEETWTNASSLSSRSSPSKTRGDTPVFQSIINRAARKVKRSAEHETLRKRQRDDVDNCKT